MCHPSKMTWGTQLIVDALTVTEGSVHQCRWHNVSVRSLVLLAWVKARLSVGQLLTHHYGSLSHLMSCKCNHINPYLNSGLHHHPPHKQAVLSFDAEGTDWLESNRDQLESLKSPAQSAHVVSCSSSLRLLTKWQEYSQNTTIFISYERVDHIAVYNYMFRPLSAIVRLQYFLL